MKNQINAQNWTGEVLAYDFTETSIEVYDQKFKIERLPEVPGIPEFEHYKVTAESGHSFGVTRWSGDKYFMAVSGEVVREALTVHEAAVALIANLY